MPHNVGSMSCCEELLIILNAIKNNEHVEYGTMQMEDCDGFLGIAHSMLYMHNGRDIFLSDLHYQDADKEWKICQKCVLHFYIETNYYRDVWNVNYKTDSRKFFRLSALMDIFGPNDNRLIMKKIISDKRLFNNHFRYNCQRLVNFRHGSPTFSYLIQRTKAINDINVLLMIMKKTEAMKWIIQDKRNLKHTNDIFNMADSKSYESVARFDEEFVKSLDFFCTFILVYSQDVHPDFNRYIIHNDIKLSRNAMKDQLDKADIQYDRHRRERFVKCDNKACKTNYALHKYGISPAPYRKREKTLKVINKWFICKGCQCVYYCSRECQKIAWNKQNHKTFCRQL